MFGNREFGAECPSRFEVWLELWDAICTRVFEFLVRVEGRGVGRGVEGIRPMNEGSSQGYRRGILDSEEEVGGRR